MGDFATAPNIIEQANFQAGWLPGAVDEQSGPGFVSASYGMAKASGLQDVLNFLPDESTSALVTRKGFKRIAEALVATPTSGRYIKHIASVHAQTSANTKHGLSHYLVVATTNDLTTANNVRIYAINLSRLEASARSGEHNQPDINESYAVTRIDTSGVTWDNPTSDFWMVPINNVLYGGSDGNPMFSWDGALWNAAAGTGSWKTVVDAVNDAVTTSSEFARDYAFKGTEKVYYGAPAIVYSPNTKNRFAEWASDDNQHYNKGDKVSHKATWASTSAYYKSFQCIEAHDASVATTEPGVGATWKTYWKKLQLGVPENDDYETRPQWDFCPQPSETKVAAYYADRLWLRFDGYGADRLQYSAPVKPQHDKDIPDTVFDPTDFAPGNDIKGAGGGWLAFNEGRNSGPITAVHPLGNQMLVFKRNTVFALTGWSEESFDIRVIRRGVGAVSTNAHTEVDGICYFLDADGLYMSDGTDVQPVPGNAGIRDYIRSRIHEMNFDFHTGFTPTVFRLHQFVGIALSAGNEYVTLFYDPASQSFWKTDLPVGVALRTGNASTPERLVFGAPAGYGGVLVYHYAGRTDDLGMEEYEQEVPIDFDLVTEWWPFGLLKSQRRVRRTWAVVKGLGSYTLSAFTDWDSETPKNVHTITNDTEFSTHIEGRWVPDSHAIQFELEGSTTDEVVLHGIACETEPRRMRYHT